MCQGLFTKKFAGLWPAALLKKRLWHRCFPVNFVKVLSIPFFIEHLWTTASGIIDKFQNYFGIAIQQSTGKTLRELQKTKVAVLFHCSEASDLDTRHQMCPRTNES